MENDTENSKDNHRTEPQARKCDTCKFLFAEEMSKKQFLFFSSFYFSFPLARETRGACIFPHFIAQSSYQKCLLLLQPNFWWQMWRQASQLCVSFPKCRPANPLPLCDVLSQPSVVWTGLCDQIQRLWTTPCQKNPKPNNNNNKTPVCGSYPTHTTSISRVASAAWWQCAREHWHYYQNFFTLVEPFFTLVGGPRKHEQCLWCTSPVLSAVSVGWISTWHLYCDWRLPKKNWQILEY